jgi:hypothetical protein
MSENALTATLMDLEKAKGIEKAKLLNDLRSLLWLLPTDVLVKYIYTIEKVEWLDLLLAAGPRGRAYEAVLARRRQLLTHSLV